MEFRLISDVHNEFYHETTQYTLPYLGGDENRVLVIAGDFTMLKRAAKSASALTAMAKRFKAVVYVPGNHEYYGYRIDPVAARKKFQDMNPEGLTNIHFLIRDSVVIDGVRFVGATLWTNMDRQSPLVEFHLGQKMNDFKAITYYHQTRQSYQKYKPHHWIMEHKADLSYIAETVEASDEPCIVVTHHAPSYQSLDPAFAWDIDGNHGYHSDLDDFIHNHPQISHWLHGHIHHPSDYIIGCTNVICNPYGYAGEDVAFLDRSYYDA
ncbi:3',5'-cyclic adenosine monophosphate phosphodiesterase CpdA [compost metagenome]